jgi:hypothetical protein
VIAEEPLAPGTLAVALPGTVDAAHAPVPASLAERIAFRSLYETLIRVDCEGEVRPELAASWRREGGGRRWVFELRPDAVFSDGLPVTAAAVAASWRSDERRRPRPWLDSVATSVTVVGERRLSVSLDRPHPSVPRIFAHPGLAVARPTPDGSAWALGSGTHVVAAVADDGFLAIPRGVMRGDRPTALSFRATGTDPRDLVDAGADLMVTRDPSVSAYASATGAARVLPLGWDVVYVLVIPAADGDTSRLETVELPDDLTAAAAAADARVPRRPYWWEDAGTCPLDGPPANAAHLQPPVPRILYRADDLTARGLAERVVALLTSGRLTGMLPSLGNGTQIAAGGLDRPAYDVVLREGGVAAYVVALDRTVLDTCLAVRTLVESVAWRATLVPLVETRAHLVVRRLAGTIALDWDGTPYLTAPARAP